jgi:hypothetical protein
MHLSRLVNNTAKSAGVSQGIEWIIEMVSLRYT